MPRDVWGALSEASFYVWNGEGRVLWVTAQVEGAVSLVSFPASPLVASPVPTITWKRADGKPIARKARRHKSSGILEIPNFQQEDTGAYECVAENSRGRNVARGQLTFYGTFLMMASRLYTFLVFKS